MSQSFDAYHIWLGIPAEEQPPHLYRLLGLDALESNTNAIANAVDLRQRHLQSCLNSPHRDRAEHLMSEIGSAGQVLLNPQSKAQYDQQLRSQLGGGQPTMRPVPLGGPAANPVPVHSPAGSSTYPWAVVGVAVGGALLLMLGMAVAAIVWKLSSRKDDATKVASGPTAVPIKQVEPPKRPLDEPSEFPLTDPQPTPAKTDVDTGASDADATSPKTKLVITTPKKKNKGKRKRGKGGKGKVKKRVNKTEEVESPAPAPVVDKAPSGPLDQLPSPLALPSLLVHEPRDLGPLGPSDKEFELELIGGFAQLPDDSQFHAGPVPNGKERWRVIAAPNEKSAGVPIAEFAALSGALKFVWLDGAPVELAQQLQNSLLRIGTGQHYRELPLRGPLEEGPYKVSLAKANDVRMLDLKHLPNRDRTYLQIEPLQNFPTTAAFKDGERLAQVGKTLAIELTERPGAEIRIRLDKKGRDGLAIVLSPVYNPNAAIDFDLSVDRLTKMKTGTQKAILSGQKDLAKRKTLYESLKRQYGAVNRQSATNAVQRQAKGVALGEISRKMAAASKKVASLQVKLPQLQARLKAMPEAEKLVAKIHEQAELRMRVFAVDDDQNELTLYSAGYGAKK